MRFLTHYWLSVHKGEDPIEKLLTLDAHKILLAKTVIKRESERESERERERERA